LLGALDENQRRVLRNALIGFFKKAGVVVVRAQVEKRLDPLGLEFRLTEAGLTVSSPQGEEAVVYDVDSQERLIGQGDARLLKDLPTFSPRELLFRANPLSWEDWVDEWECEQAGYAKELMRGLPLW